MLRLKLYSYENKVAIWFGTKNVPLEEDWGEHIMHSNVIGIFGRT